MAYPPAPGPRPQPVNNQGNLDAMRRRLQGQNQNMRTNEANQTTEALQRKFAAGGLANSGAAIGMQQKAVESVNDRYNQQLSADQGSIDQMEFQAGEAEKGRQFQSGEAGLGRQFQQGMFDKTHALDSATKFGQLDLAKREMDLKDLEQQFNAITSAQQQGYGVSLLPYLPGNALDSGTGQRLNESGPQYMTGGSQAPAGSAPAPSSGATMEALQRRIAEENARREQEQALAQRRSNIDLFRS